MFRVFPEQAVPLQADDAEDGFAEDGAVHLGSAEHAVHEYYRHLHHAEAHAVGRELHLYLEGIALETDGVEVERLKHAAAVAYEAGGGVVDRYARDEAHVLAGIVGHEHTPHGPVDDVHARDIARAHGHVCAVLGAGLVEAFQVLGIVAEVGIHLEDIVVAGVERAAEALDVGRAETELAGTLGEQHAARILRHLLAHDGGSAVGRVVVNHEHVEAVRQFHHCVDDCRRILSLVVHRYYHYAVASVGTAGHGLWHGNGLECKFNAIFQIRVLSERKNTLTLRIMSNDEELDDYIAAHIDPEPPALHALWRRTYARHVYPRMCSGHAQGRILRMLSALTRPRRAVELGTFTGYSALCLAEGMPADGELHTIEIDDEMEPELEELFAAPHPGARIVLHTGDALDVLPQLPAPWDLAFIDANKRCYVQYYELLVPRMSPGGIILTDNTLWSGKILHPDRERDPQTRGLLEFNDRVATDPRVERVILPLRDGLTLIRVK